MKDPQESSEGLEAALQLAVPLDSLVFSGASSSSCQPVKIEFQGGLGELE